MHGIHVAQSSPESIKDGTDPSTVAMARCWQLRLAFAGNRVRWSTPSTISQKKQAWLQPSCTAPSQAGCFIRGRLSSRRSAYRPGARRESAFAQSISQGAPADECVWHASHISVALARYLRWSVSQRFPSLSCSRLTTLPHTRLGVNTRVFHLGDYRRATVGQENDIPDDYFFVNGTATHSVATSSHLA